MPPSQKSILLVIDETNPSSFEKITSDSFINLNIWERNHIQEWIRKAPEILGEELLTLTIEFDKFSNSSDRLDILALDKKANLVVIELKRDSFAGYADLQAIRYASMVSSMTIDKLLSYFLDYQRKYFPEQPLTTESARDIIKEFVDDEFTDFSTRPRIILCSENFSSELTTSVLWLNQFGVDISCVRIKPHRIDGKIIIVPTVIIPIPEAKQYQTEIQQKEEAIQVSNNRIKRPTTIKLLVEENKIKAGDKIYLKDNLPEYVINAKSNIASQSYFEAEITGKLGKNNAIKWLYDNKEYSISLLTYNIFTELHPLKQSPSAVAGGEYWQTESGKNLYLWADEVWKDLNN